MRRAARGDAVTLDEIDLRNPSHWSRASAPCLSVISTTHESLTAIGRLESVCGEIGTSASAGTVGWMIGPFADSA